MANQREASAPVDQPVAHGGFPESTTGSTTPPAEEGNQLCGLHCKVPGDKINPGNNPDAAQLDREDRVGTGGRSPAADTCLLLAWKPGHSPSQSASEVDLSAHTKGGSVAHPSFGFSNSNELQCEGLHPQDRPRCLVRLSI